MRLSARNTRHTTRAARVALLVTALVIGPADASADDPGATKVEPETGLEFVSVPGGTFHFGCEPQDTDCADDERPGRQVTIAPMWLGKTEVTVLAFGRCVDKGACTTPNTGGACTFGVAGREKHPVNCVDWAQASAFCRFAGGRLPTAEEWEYASKGGESRIYPWGDTPVTDKRANFADTQFKKRYPRSFDIPGQDDGYIETAPVGSYASGASKHGLLDLTGNVLEWTSSDYQPGLKEARGGGWATDTRSRRLRNSYRTGRRENDWHATYGFRCRLGAPPKKPANR